MTKYHKILVPVSLEEGADIGPALKTAQHLAAAQAEVVLLHVIDEIPGYASSYLPPGFQDKIRQQIEAALKAIGGDQNCVEAAVLPGKPIKIIPEYCAIHSVDCIVLSAKEADFKDPRAFEVLAQVLRFTTCAVHIIR